MPATLISGERTRTGDELDDRAQRVAGGLAALGLAVGDVVTVLMRNDFPVLEVAFGAERAGMVVVPLNWHGQAEDVGFILRDSGARVLIAHADLLARVRDVVPLGCCVVSVEVPLEIRAAYRLDDDAATIFPEDTGYEAWLAAAPPRREPPATVPFRLLYTSGTSGKPKGVIRRLGTSEVAERAAARARAAHGLDRTPIRAVMTGPLYHSAPNVYAMNCVRRGELLVLMPRFDASGLIDLIERHRISHLHAVPTMFSRLLDLPERRRKDFDASTLRAVVHGAAMCPPDVKQAMIAWWGPVLLEYYAATELGIITASTSEEWLRHPGSVGRPPDGVEIAIMDDAGTRLGPGEVGEILISTDISQAVSYHNRPDALAELQRGDWVTMGDVGYLDPDGFLWLCDRKKDMVISGGVNVFPAEVEGVLGQQPGVRDCVVFGVPDRDLGEVLVACVEPQPGASLDAAALQGALLQRLGRLKVPRTIHFTAFLPREDSGKLARRKMKADYLSRSPEA